MTTPQPISFVAARADFTTGKDTPRNFLERCLARVEGFESAVGAFVCQDTAVARAAADGSTERWRAGRPLTPIDGMPLGIKDIIETADMPTEQGSPLFGYVTPGYHRAAELDGEAFDRDGYFLTGDLGTIEADGRIRFRGRLKGDDQDRRRQRRAARGRASPAAASGHRAGSAS